MVDKSVNKILVTGGCGYIGSHTTLLLLEAGFDVVVVDNLANSSKESLRRVEQLASKSVELCQIDVRDSEALTVVFAKHEFKFSHSRNDDFFFTRGRSISLDT